MKDTMNNKDHRDHKDQSFMNDIEDCLFPINTVRMLTIDG